MRDRLIELLENMASQTDDDRCRGCEGDCVRCNYENIADHLLANDVTVLPCKVGDTVWSIADCGTEPVELKVRYIILHEDKIVIWLKTRHHQFRMASPEAFGKTIFNMRTKAVEVMKGGEG